MIKKILILPDVHLGIKPPKPYLVAKEFAKWYKPDEIVLLGDFMSIDALSGYDLSKKRKIEGQRYEKELDVAQIEIDELLKICKNIVWLEGNHEDRVERYLDDHPELEGMLEIPHRLKLNKCGIQWIKYGHEVKRSKLVLSHGIYYNASFAKKTALEYGCCIAVGHTHRFQVYTYFPKKQKYPFVCYGLGTLGDVDPEYAKGKPTGHLNQFAIVEYSERQFNLFPINIVHDSFIYNGKLWSLNKKESKSGKK